MLRNQSVIDPSKFVDEKQWVVSALNTTGSLLEGHSAIVVEGPNFIGQYDVAANAATSGWCRNTKGYITKIKCRGDEEKDKIDRNYYKAKKIPAESFYISPQKAREMIASIKEDEIRAQKAMENWTKRDRGEPLHLDAQGRPIEPIKYQKLGKNHFLAKIIGDQDAGDNCAGWVIDKLAVGGVGDGTAKPKPAWIAGQIPCASFFKRPLLVATTVASVVGAAVTAAYCRRS